MSITITFDPNTTTPQERILQNASAHMDGMMTPLMVAKLAALWTDSGLPNPTVADRTMRLRITPSVTMPFGVIVPNATLNNAGIITAAQVRALDTLFVASGLPVPSAPNVLPVRVRYSFSLQFAEIIISAATERSCGAMTALMAAQLIALVNQPPTYGAIISAAHPTLWWRFNDVSPSAVIVDTQGFQNGTQNSPGATLYRQPGLITQANQFSVGAVNSLASFGSAVIPAGIPLAGGWTMEWWTAVQPLAMFQNAMSVGTDGPSQVIMACFDGAGSASGLIGGTPVLIAGAGTFAITRNYYAITYDGASTRFYKNGVLLTTSAAALTGTRVNHLGFGSGASGGAHFGGFMDEMALYARTLGAPELLTHYAAGIQ